MTGLIGLVVIIAIFLIIIWALKKIRSDGMKEWFYLENEKHIGPINPGEIQSIIVKGNIKKDTLVWSEGMAEWVKAIDTELALFLPPSAYPRWFPGLIALMFIALVCIGPIYEKTGEIMSLLIVILLILFFYFIPAIVGRKKKNSTAIFMLNLFLGWTLVGWVVALVWACTVDN